MRSSFASCVSAALSFTIFFIVVADLTGTWKGKSDTGREVLLKLKADGQNLTGTVTIDQGKEQAISNGKVADNSISFSIPSLYGGSKLTVKGKLEGDELHLQFESEGGDVIAKLQAKKQ